MQSSDWAIFSTKFVPDSFMFVKPSYFSGFGLDGEYYILGLARVIFLALSFLMVFNSTFNNISVISWRSVLLVDETGENHRPVASHRQTLSHNVVHIALIEIRTHNISGDRH